MPFFRVGGGNRVPRIQAATEDGPRVFLDDMIAAIPPQPSTASRSHLPEESASLFQNINFLQLKENKKVHRETRIRCERDGKRHHGKLRRP